jgi:porin
LQKFRQAFLAMRSLVILLLSASPALAQDAAPGLLGDLGGLRPQLGNDGITIGVVDSENLLGNLSGGVKQGATLQGVATGMLEIDTGKAFGLPGGLFHVTALQIHGENLSAAYLDSLQTANGNEAEDTTRLWELWYDQSIENGRADIKIGQQSIDNEFLISKYSGLFINTAAGWPLLPSYDLYGGGPAYPLASLGVRLQAKPAGNTNILAGVFDDNPGGGPFSADAQRLDAAGAKFNLNTGALFIAELQYGVNQAGRGLPSMYKIGAWYDTGFFPDQRLAGEIRKGNYSVYGVVDQTVWQSASDHSRNLNLFGRIMAAPDGQNLIDFSVNGGVALAAPLPDRDNDQAGLDIGIGRVSRRAAGLDQDDGLPQSGIEMLVELTYQAQVTPWLQLQPDIQYVIHPGAGLLDPEDGTRLLANEFVAGLRAITTF